MDLKKTGSAGKAGNIRGSHMRKQQRPFNYHWGSGYVAEEAQVRGEHHMPALQLLKYTSIRFCHYSHAGRFARSPLLMSPEEIDMMREALHGTPELRSLLQRLVAD